MHTLETNRRAPVRPSWRRIAARWIVTFAGFPAGGLTAMLLVGQVDSVIGETTGYFLTAVFTVLVVRAVTRASAPRWMAYLGYTAAALIATGVLVPLGLDIARLANFAGYVSWCCWLVAMAIVLWRDKPQGGRQRLAAANAAVGSA